MGHESLHGCGVEEVRRIVVASHGVRRRWMATMAPLEDLPWLFLGCRATSSSPLDPTFIRIPTLMSTARYLLCAANEKTALPHETFSRLATFLVAVRPAGVGKKAYVRRLLFS